jgi:hypothetical protein
MNKLLLFSRRYIVPRVWQYTNRFSFADGKGNIPGGATLMPEAKFKSLCEDYFQDLAEQFEEKSQSMVDEVECSAEFFSLRCKEATILLNRQVPNRQIWFSSPVRYESRKPCLICL